MSNRHGEFIWYELATPAVDDAAAFYGDVLGWQVERAGVMDIDYRIFTVDGAKVAGLTTLPADAGQAGMGPGWFGYIGVDDVDATVTAVVAAGGGRHVPPTDIPGVGRFALLTDPQGAAFYAMRGAGDETSTAFAQAKTGHCHWNELATSDQAAAIGFYGAHFGWEPGDAMPMGELGEYRFITHHGQTLGAVMTQPVPGAPSSWLFYFGVADIDGAKTAVTDGGGIVRHGPVEVPGGVFIIIASDPQGATFGLVGPRRQ